MYRVRERVDIAAPVEWVWAAVHRDIAEVATWARSFLRTEVVGGGTAGVGSELRYVVRLPGGLTRDLRMHIDVYDEYRRCAGTVEGPGMHGTWKWTYTSRDGITRVVYETSVELHGALRLASRVVGSQVEDDVRADLDALKRHVESGRRKQRVR